jgi:hypothetical protein
MRRPWPHWGLLRHGKENLNFYILLYQTGRQMIGKHDSFPNFIPHEHIIPVLQVPEVATTAYGSDKTNMVVVTRPSPQEGSWSHYQATDVSSESLSDKNISRESLSGKNVSRDSLSGNRCLKGVVIRQKKSLKGVTIRQQMSQGMLGIKTAFGMGLHDTAQSTLCKYTHHSDDLRVHRLSEHTPACRYVVDQLIQSSSFDLLPLQVGHWVHEVKRHTALSQFADKQLLLLCGWHICTKGKSYLMLYMTRAVALHMRFYYQPLHNHSFYAYIFRLTIVAIIRKSNFPDMRSVQYVNE